MRTGSKPRLLPAEAPLVILLAFLVVNCLIRRTWLAIVVTSPLCLLIGLYLLRKALELWKARQWPKASDRIRGELLSKAKYVSVTPIVMPPLGQRGKTAIIASRHKAPGDMVTQGDPIVTAVFGRWAGVKVPSPTSGQLLAIHAYPYDKVLPGAVLGEIIVENPLGGDGTLIDQANH
jgi:hypothetical protein